MILYPFHQVEILENQRKEMAYGSSSIGNQSSFEIQKMGYGYSTVIQDWNDTEIHSSHINDDLFSVLHENGSNLTLTIFNSTLENKTSIDPVSYTHLTLPTKA